MGFFVLLAATLRIHLAPPRRVPAAAATNRRPDRHGPGQGPEPRTLPVEAGRPAEPRSIIASAGAVASPASKRSRRSACGASSGYDCGSPGSNSCPNGYVFRSHNVDSIRCLIFAFDRSLCRWSLLPVLPPFLSASCVHACMGSACFLPPRVAAALHCWCDPRQHRSGLFATVAHLWCIVMCGAGTRTSRPRKSARWPRA